MVLDAVVHSLEVVDGCQGQVGRLGVVVADGYVELVEPGFKWSVVSAAAVGNLDELHGGDVVVQGPACSEDVVNAGDGERVSPDGRDELTCPDG